MTEIDVDAILAAQDEIDGEPHKVIWGGQTFLVPRLNQWPTEVIDLYAEGKVTTALAVTLGDQWDAFHEARHPTLGAAEAILNGVAQAEGFGSLGESLASSPSSNRAMRRSRPTSAGSTKRTSSTSTGGG